MGVPCCAPPGIAKKGNSDLPEGKVKKEAQGSAVKELIKLIKIIT